MHKFASIATLLFLAASVMKQSSPQVVSEVNVATPKPGMTAQWEAGRKQHSAFHAAQKDTWSILVWEFLTGERTGSYLMSSPGHNWKDFDAREAFNKLDRPDVDKTIGPPRLEAAPPTTCFATISASPSPRLLPLRCGPAPLTPSSQNT